MIIIDTLNNVYNTQNGNYTLIPDQAWYIFTPPEFIPQKNSIFKSRNYNPITNTFDERFDYVYVNPWTYWTNTDKLNSIRLQRDFILQQTDWRAIRSYETGIPESQAWLDYRQELRDFPDVVDVDLPIQQIVWPTPPNS